MDLELNLLDDFGLGLFFGTAASLSLAFWPSSSLEEMDALSSGSANEEKSLFVLELSLAIMAILDCL